MLSSLLNLRSICAPFQHHSENTGIAMRTYYFDTRDGIPTRDRRGIEFPTAAGAIEHSKELARRLRSDHRLKDPGLSIAVVDESGAEIHREPVYSDATEPCVSRGNNNFFDRID
jgi:hypothetical protein